MKGYCTWLLFCLILPVFLSQVESQRSGGNICSLNEVPCDDNFECISRDSWCDKKVDCLDRSDQQYCETKGWFGSVKACNKEKHFECGNGPCVPISTRCDGFENCQNGADEENCNKTEEEESDSVETTSEPPKRSDEAPDSIEASKNEDVSEFDVFKDDDDWFDNDNFVITTTSETIEAASSPSYVAPITYASQAPVDNYYVKKYTENTNINTYYDYNRAQYVHPRYSNNQQGSHSQIYENGRRKQTDTLHTSNQYDSKINIRPSDENIIKLPPRIFLPDSQPSISNTHQTNNQYSNGKYVGTEYSSEASVTFPFHTFPPAQPSITGTPGNEANTRSSYPGDTIIRLPPRIFLPDAQPSISNTHQANSQYGNGKYVGSEYSSEASVMFPSHTFPPVQPFSGTPGNEANARPSNPSDTIIRLPPRIFLPNAQPSISNTHHADSQYGNEKFVGSEYSSEASVTFLSHAFPPVQPSISGSRGNEANGRSSNPDDTIIRLPPRIFLPNAQPSKSDIQYTKSLHSSKENVVSWEQGRTLTSAADYPAEHLSPAQPADHHNSADRIQSDVSQPEHYVQRNRRDAPFHFRHNYTQKFGYYYKDNVQNAKDWILSQRNISFGWGKDTPRALIALSLITNTFSFKFTENELMKKSLATGFGIRMHLMRDKEYSERNTNILTNSTLATYVNALLGTCQDPKNFFSNNLTQELLNKTTFSGTDVNPVVYLTLCLTNTPIDRNELHKLMRLLTIEHQDERSRDMQILATTALACFQRQEHYKRQLEGTVKAAFDKLIERRLPNFSFGSKYSTALAAQALMSIDTNEWRDARKTLDYLAGTQSPDGSFGDMLATYLIVPALSGRSLLHLRNTQCDPVIPPQPKIAPTNKEFVEGPGPKKNIFYTIKVGYPETFTVTTSCLEIGLDKNFFFAMRKAENFNSQFRFLYKKLENDKIDVHTIIDIPNDTERGFRWRLFKGDARQGVEVNFRKPIEEDVAELIPENYEEYVYWYLPMLMK